MVRQLHMEMDDEVFENTHPGCIWGVFHVLNYNYWHKNVKKMLPYSSTKHNQTKHSKGTSRPRTRLIAYDSDEVESLLDVETSRIPVKSSTRKTISTNKKSLRTRIKSLISEEPLKKENYRRKPRFQRTYSIHHLECSDYVTRISTHNNIGAKQSQDYYANFNKSGKGHVLEKYGTEEKTRVDVLEIYGVNKDMFAKVSKYTDRGIAQSFLNLPRSGSYPSPKLSQFRTLKPINLEHKQKEGWCHSKVDKLFADLKPQVVDGTPKYSRRTLSLNESSLEKYAQLLPKSSIGEPKLSSSKSLRLTNECSFKRARSLSLIGSYGAFLNEPSGDSNTNPENDSCFYENVRRNDSDETMEDMCNLVDSISEEDKAEVPKVSEEIEEQLGVLKDLKKEEDSDFAQVPDNKLPRSSSFTVVHGVSEEDETHPTDILASEDFSCEDNSSDKESSVDSQRECCSKFLSRSTTISNEVFNNNGDESEFHKRSYDDFDFVSDILEKSGFNGSDFFASWYSSDQPLNPSIFDEVEACWPHEDVLPKDEFCCHHQLLFDLINELLVQIYDTSFTYYPRALSSNCHVPSIHSKFSILNEVWSKVSKIMNSNLESNQTVEDIVAQDMWSDNIWMNLQLDTECVGLELEDLYFDEILEEILSTF